MIPEIPAAEPARDRDGFLIRGAASTRLEAFVDAAFAFAVTLLVIGGTELPASLADLRNALKDIPAFAASFALIAQVWWSHYTYSQRYGLEDGRTIVCSMLLVFLVLVYVYPLKLLFTTFFVWISGGWLQNRPLKFDSLDDVRAMFAIYGMAWSVLSVLFASMLRNALAQARTLALTARELLHTRYDLWHWIINLGFGLVSTLLALQLPDRLPYNWLYGLPGLIYFGLAPSHMLLSWRRRKALAALLS